MKLTLAITVYNRYEMLLESFAQVIDDPRIDEILIMDDASKDEYWNKIKELPKFNDKIKVVRQLENRGMSVNKRDAIFNSKNEWVLIGDSDNVFDKDYLNALERIWKRNDHPNKYWIYSPSFARPTFDYRKFEDYVFNIDDLPKLNDPSCNCLFNTCNFVVNRDEYLKKWQENKEMKASDTIWMNYLWLKCGNSFYVVPGMYYFHRVHDGSGFMEDAAYNMNKAEEVKKKILSL
jgi:glycosyltransferase involved in cell wall biosynthesis